ncbi:helix-turn-helix transcriptional regulator [Bosea sp. Root483D1]|uniref:helix-turn-helix domain-containing protein n=1 Tax=Bosea sp. Root483D1 TaxID=1736544 RepID=UPI002A4E22A9|nr:helix-turn-helix transcriptional regulator [Bosea sp. Root483D1]
MTVGDTLLAFKDIEPYMRFMITPAQIRAARALIGWKQTDLAVAAGLSEMSIKNIERGENDPRVSTLSAIQKAFELAGVIFVPENGEGPGLRLRKIVPGQIVRFRASSEMEARFPRSSGETYKVQVFHGPTKTAPRGLVDLIDLAGIRYPGVPVSELEFC